MSVGGMKLNIDTKAVGRIKAKLHTIENVIYVVAKDRVIEGAGIVLSQAKTSILHHQSKGEVYKRGKKEHTASAPGYPPNSDTGNLVKTTGMEFDPTTLVAVVGTNNIVGRWLEDGTATIDERPWLGPAFNQNIKEINKSVREAVSKAIVTEASKNVG